MLLKKKVEEVKPQVQEKVEQAKAAGAQLADYASKKAGEAKEAAGEAANTILGTAIHAKDVAVEKVQEIGHTVNSNSIASSSSFRTFRSRKLCKAFQQQQLMQLVLPLLMSVNNSLLLDNGFVS